MPLPRRITVLRTPASGARVSVRLGVGAVVALGGLLARCGTSHPLAVSAGVAAGAHASSGCPSLARHSDSGVAVDYADFIEAQGRQFVSARDLLVPQPRVGADDVGILQFRVDCSLSRLNDRTHQMPPPARDHDAGTLSAGTPVYQLRGWPTTCRLVARTHGVLTVYLATDPSASSAQPAKCALEKGS